MIRTPKKQLYSRGILLPVLSLILCVSLPVFLTFSLKLLTFKKLALVYLAYALVLFFLFKKKYAEKRYLQFSSQELEEKINILSDQNGHEGKDKISFQQKLARYSSLKNIIEEISQKLALDAVSNILVTQAFSLVAEGKGNCILYLLDPRAQLKLNIFKSKKEDKELVIKAKEGDTFDSWVLKHCQPLLVTDARGDFRFDFERLKKQSQRQALSLISCPLISHNRFLGILRLDSPLVLAYSQDDLRLLAMICDIGAVAIENAELFEKTQDLAIRDGLTSLYRKNYFLERLKEECKRAIRKNSPLSLLMLDIDYFKAYNDKFGHSAGDIVLKKISLLMQESLDKINAVISRFGGEEFCVILTNTDKNQALKQAQDLREVIEKTTVILRREKSNITVSIGAASFPADASCEDELILKADQALYNAKRSGRNRVELC